MMREAIILDKTVPVDVIVIPDGADGDAMLSKTCVEITGLDPKPGVGNGWTYAAGKWVQPPQPPLTVDDIRSARRARYQAETDGLYFEAMRDGGDLTAWKAATAQIRADLPYPEAP